MPPEDVGERQTEVPGDALIWPVDPVQVALTQAERRRTSTGSEPAVCAEVGRRLLLAEFSFAHWVLRRVEKVRFASDRRIARTSSIEFRVPRYAPVVRLPGGSECWLVPLTVMRRRTLVSLTLRDEQGAGISLLGMRFTQMLDEAMLTAAARLVRAHAEAEGQPIETFIREVVSGNWWEVEESLGIYENWLADRSTPAATIDPLRPYFENNTFRATLDRLGRSFSLYVLLPTEEGRHRRLELSFEERVRWRYQKPNLSRMDGGTDSEGATAEDEVWAYEPLARHQWAPRLRRVFGLWPTRIRFLTPSAENCASYHFEFTAPTGLEVVSAAFVGGRPNEAIPKTTSWDEVTNSGHSAGLHAVEIRSGSLCRSQVHLRVPARGWLNTLVVSCLAVALTLLAVAWHTRLFDRPGQWKTDQITNIVLLLVTVCAGASTYVAQHSAGDVAARMLAGVRAAGVVALGLPAIAAVSLVFLQSSKGGGVRSESGSGGPGWIPDPLIRLAERTSSPTFLQWELWVLFAFSIVILAMTALVAAFSARAGRRIGRHSPWDMASIPEPRPTWWFRDRRRERRRPHEGPTMTYHELVAKLKLDRPAIGVYSAEGWVERYEWNDGAQRHALRALRGTSTEYRRAVCSCSDVGAHPPITVDEQRSAE